VIVLTPKGSRPWSDPSLPADWCVGIVRCMLCDENYHESGTEPCKCALCLNCDGQFTRVDEDDLECSTCREQRVCAECGERFEPIAEEKECLDCET
jgi:hypothetical protein